MTENKRSEYVDKNTAVKMEISSIKRLCGVKSNETLQIIVPYLEHISEEERNDIISYDPDVDVLSDFPRVKDLDTGNAMKVKEYIYKNYNIMILHRRDKASYYILTIYWRIIRKEKE